MKKENIIPVSLIIGVITLWFLTPVITCHFSGEPKDIGIIGDQYGSVNALFSGLAFVGVIWAILLQQTDLKLQRKSIDLQQKELNNNTAELKNQAKALRGQLEVAKLTAQLNTIPALMETEDEHLCRVTNKDNGTYLSYTDEMLENSIEALQIKIDRLNKDATKKNEKAPEGFRTPIYDEIDNIQISCEKLEDQLMRLKNIDMFRRLRMRLFQKISDIKI